MLASVAPCRSPGACRTLWRNWSRSSPEQSALANTSTTSIKRCSLVRSTPWLRISVNLVGVDVNTASAPLLARACRVSIRHWPQTLIAFRDEHGAFKTRTSLKKVPRLGPKAFEQAAGFLRIMNGKNPLDASAVHPEAYALVEKIAAVTKRGLNAFIGDGVFLKSLKPATFADADFGIPTVSDVLKELEKPGAIRARSSRRRPLPRVSRRFRISSRACGSRASSPTLPPSGAFVDVGVHQDGLVHISELSDRFVKDPREVVKAGDVVKVRVKSVDVARKRIGLTMKSGAIESSPSPANAAATKAKGSACRPRHGRLRRAPLPRRSDGRSGRNSLLEISCDGWRSTRMRLGILLRYAGEAGGPSMDQVLEAERLGFDSVWAGESYGTDAVTPIARVLARTTKIKAGTGIMQMSARTPTCAAMTAATLQAMSQSRFRSGSASGPPGDRGMAWHALWQSR